MGPEPGTLETSLPFDCSRKENWDPRERKQLTQFWWQVLGLHPHLCLNGDVP